MVYQIYQSGKQEYGYVPNVVTYSPIQNFVKMNWVKITKAGGVTLANLILAEKDNDARAI